MATALLLVFMVGIKKIIRMNIRKQKVRQAKTI